MILGFDIGGTHTTVIIGSERLGIVDRVRFYSQPRRGFEVMWKDIVHHGHLLVTKYGQPTLIGVSIGGPMDFSTGTILSPPNLPGWDNIPLRQMLEDEFRTPAFVEHDAKAGALAEWLFGAARGLSDVIFLTFGTGLGAGLILDGHLYRGASDSAGFVGHWRIAEDGPFIWGKAGSWEGYSSGVGLVALAHYRFPNHFPNDITGADIIQQARGGSTEAIEIVETSAEALGRGMALLIDLLNPQIIVLGSLAVRAGDLFLPIVERIVAKEVAPEGLGICKIVPAALGNQIGEMAALCAALYHANQRKDPTP